jgi:hypothetical protein
MALARLGDTDNFIQDLATDTSEEGMLLNTFYPNQRDSLLAALWWPFATRRAQLAQLVGEPPRAGWSYVYGLPVDCLTPRYIYPSGLATQAQSLAPPPTMLYGVYTNPRTPRPDQRVPFVIEASMQSDAQNNFRDDQVLLCDYLTPTLIYTSKITNPEKFPPVFGDALAWAIAKEIALPLTKKPSLKKECEAEFERAWKIALSVAFNAEQEDSLPDSEFVAGRQ